MKKWCKHIKWKRKHNDYIIHGLFLIFDTWLVPKRWKGCPICSAPRPKKAKK